MKRIYCLIVVLLSFYVMSFCQESEMQIIDTVRISENMYKIGIDGEWYVYENMNDTLRLLPDNIDYRYLGDSYPVKFLQHEEMFEMIAKELHHKMTKQVCDEIRNKMPYHVWNFYLYADVEGNIKEVVTHIPANVYPYFSVADFDRIMPKILKYRLTVDNENQAFAKGRWVRYVFTITIPRWYKTLQKYEQKN